MEECKKGGEHPHTRKDKAIKKEIGGIQPLDEPLTFGIESSEATSVTDVLQC